MIPFSDFKPKKIEYKAIKTSKKIIVIDPGHGGKDPGGIGWNRVKEKNIVLPIGKYLRDILRKKGYKVYLTRDRDKFITLRNRTKFANRKKADLFISIHCNIAPKHPEVYGIETYFLSPARSKRAERVAKLENSAIGNLQTSTQKIVLNFLNKTKIIQSQKMAIDIQKNLIYGFRKHYKNIKDGGVRPAPFWVLVGTQMPAILIETGFISNKMEAKRLSDKIYQKRYAEYIANGIESYFFKFSILVFKSFILWVLYFLANSSLVIPTVNFPKEDANFNNSLCPLCKISNVPPTTTFFMAITYPYFAEIYKIHLID